MNESTHYVHSNKVTSLREVSLSVSSPSLPAPLSVKFDQRLISASKMIKISIC